MSGLRAQVRILQEEIERQGKAVNGQQDEEMLNENEKKQLDKVSLGQARRYYRRATNVPQILKDYDKQLEHIKKGVQDMAEEYQEYEKEKKAGSRR